MHSQGWLCNLYRNYLQNTVVDAAILLDGNHGITDGQNILIYVRYAVAKHKTELVGIKGN